MKRISKGFTITVDFIQNIIFFTEDYFELSFLTLIGMVIQSFILLQEY